MNIRKIITYNSLRKGFTPDELAFADALYNATESERELLINALQPEKPAGKKASKKASKKSARASSLQEKIQGAAVARSLDGGVSKMRCIQSECGEYADNPIHDPAMGYAGYHEFDSGQAAVSTTAGTRD